MLAFKSGQISLYFHLNKIMKGPGTSFQSLPLSQKHVRNVCHTAHIVWTPSPLKRGGTEELKKGVEVWSRGRSS